MIAVCEILQAGRATTEEALAVYDSLPPVEVDFMLGAWKGEDFYTSHPMDGLLETCHWHGKCFESLEEVHPLIFSTRRGKLVKVNPGFLGPFLDFPILPRSAVAGRLFQLFLELFRTRRSRARLRMTTYRGKSSATMIYDQLPINDVFRRVDENTVFGIMDRKGQAQPYFFILRREGGDQSVACRTPKDSGG